MERMLEKQRLSEWVALLDGYEVFAPAIEDNVWNYQTVNGSGDVKLEHSNTVHSPKRIVFPQREIFFEFEQEKGEAPEVREILPDSTPRVIFGVRPCDGKARVHNDKVFAGEHDDIYYWTRRNNTVNVGLACNKPHSTSCFCTAVGGSPYGEDGLDILMTDIGDAYFVKILTEKGEEIAQHADALLKKPAAGARKKVKQVHEKASRKIKRSIKGLDGAPEKLKEMFESSFWNAESNACISCGICTYLCPTCHCFDINDEVTSQSPLKGRRVRTWDTCQYPDFTMHSSGHNPRPEKGSRMRQRVCHKFQYFDDNFGEFQCTGCGRCISECPVSIDIAAVMNEVADHVG